MIVLINYMLDTYRSSFRTGKILEKQLGWMRPKDLCVGGNWGIV